MDLETETTKYKSALKKAKEKIKKKKDYQKDETSLQEKRKKATPRDKNIKSVSKLKYIYITKRINEMKTELKKLPSKSCRSKGMEAKSYQIYIKHDFYKRNQRRKLRTLRGKWQSNFQLMKDIIQDYGIQLITSKS